MIFLAVLLASTLLLGIEWLSWNVVFSRKAIFIAVVFQVSLYYNDLYDLSFIGSLNELGNRLLRSLGFAVLIVAVFYYFFPGIIIAKGVFVTSAFFVMVLIVIWRVTYNFVLKHGWFNQNIIILGSGEMSRTIIEEIQKRKDCGYNISLIVQEYPEPLDLYKLNTNVVRLSQCGGLCEMAKKLDVKKIIVALSDKRKSFPVRELLSCRTEGFPILEGQSFYEMLAGKLVTDQLNPSWLIFREGFRKTRHRLFFKRIRDIILSFCLLILSMPLIILISLIMKIGAPGPLFTIQNRVGENKNLFKIYRFRIDPIETDDKDTAGLEPKVLKMTMLIGKVLEGLHIDALPQLWNVLKGDMSLIGPRPVKKSIADQLEKSIPYYSALFTVKPGITGWAQVHYPHGASIEKAQDMLNYDLFYIKNVSFIMDMMIIMQTIKIVFLRHTPSKTTDVM